MYDLVFGYEDGDPARPRFSAGLGLQLATKMLLELLRSVVLEDAGGNRAR